MVFLPDPRFEKPINFFNTFFLKKFDCSTIIKILLNEIL